MKIRKYRISAVITGKNCSGITAIITENQIECLKEFHQLDLLFELPYLFLVITKLEGIVNKHRQLVRKEKTGKCQHGGRFGAKEEFRFSCI